MKLLQFLNLLQFTWWWMRVQCNGIWFYLNVDMKILKRWAMVRDLDPFQGGTLKLSLSKEDLMDSLLDSDDSKDPPWTGGVSFVIQPKKTPPVQGGTWNHHCPRGIHKIPLGQWWFLGSSLDWRGFFCYPAKKKPLQSKEDPWTGGVLCNPAKA